MRRGVFNICITAKDVRLFVDGKLAAFLESKDECRRFTSHHNAAKGPVHSCEDLLRFGKNIESTKER